MDLLTNTAQDRASRGRSRNVLLHRANRNSGYRTEDSRSFVPNCTPSAIGQLDWQLIEVCRHDFPICDEPFAEIACRLNSRGVEVLRRFQRLVRCGVVNWIGPAFPPGSLRTSTLVAMAVPRGRLRSIADAVIRYPGINDMCEREHEFNLWFSLAVPTAGELYDIVSDIRRRTGVEVLDLRLERDYCRDLDFPPGRGKGSDHRRLATEEHRHGRCIPLDASDRRILAATREGLSLTVRPYAVVASRAGMSEAQVIERLNRFLREGVIERMGVVLRNHPPAHNANALVVFDVSRHRVDVVGERLAGVASVTQCYRRIQRAPIWPYNLYCTLHDRDLARLIGWVDEHAGIRCPQRAVLPGRAY